MPIEQSRIRIKLPTETGDQTNEIPGDKSYRSYYVQHIQTTALDSINDLQFQIGDGERSLVLNQPTGGITEGVYLRNSATSYTLQTLDDTDVDWCFAEYKSTNKLRAVYSADTGEYTQVDFDKFLLEYNFSTTASDTSAQDVFDIPGFYDSFVTIKLKIFGVLASDKTKTYHGQFERYYYNDATSFTDSGTLTSQIFNTDSGSLPNPTITFNNSGVVPKVTLTIGSGSTAVNWFCKAELIL